MRVSIEKLVPVHANDNEPCFVLRRRGNVEYPEVFLISKRRLINVMCSDAKTEMDAATIANDCMNELLWSARLNPNLTLRSQCIDELRQIGMSDVGDREVRRFIYRPTGSEYIEQWKLQEWTFAVFPVPKSVTENELGGIRLPTPAPLNYCDRRESQL